MSNNVQHESKQTTTSDPSDKITYLLNLLGKKLPNQSSSAPPPPVTENDSDYEDIMTDEEQDIYTFDTKQQLIQSLYSSHAKFNPSLSPHDFNQDQDQLNINNNDKNEKSSTILQQQQVELLILETFKDHPQLQFLTGKHLKYLDLSLHSKLPAYFNALDANHTWMMYWLINAHKLINQSTVEIDTDTIDLINDKVESCIIKDGKYGISGGSNQIGHIASTFSGILTLVLTKNYPRLLEIRSHLYHWFISLKQSDGSFLMHINGESDSRSVYCVLAISALLNLHTDELTNHILNWINKNQSYEGGYSNNAHNECHGGYSFCSMSIYYLLFTHKSQFKTDSKINLDNLIRWLVMRQFAIEGGLNGRTNKLVDSCYAYWIGAIYPMIEVLIDQPIFNRDGLKTYLLKAGQNFDKGGFRDKPGKSTDFYHTNYSLSGLSVCEYTYDLESDDTNDDDDDELLAFKFKVANNDDNDNDDDNEKFTNAIHPIFGIPITDVNEIRQYFKNFPKPI
ncbi:beta subunit of protein farnesyltransferase [Scheffersomyces coipomensis]|uniref:beta subunit of protein farnesyltransferase n=1 Tax=Scheffersomyces coipomensis TaxID=1788519 RepID=UPI00315D4BF1